jgi:signal transduction histidine kinase
VKAARVLPPDAVTDDEPKEADQRDAEHVPHVFDRFYRIDPARTGENGAGLGLSLWQSIVKGLGGRIAVQSQLGNGTSFLVTIPTGEGG